MRIGVFDEHGVVADLVDTPFDLVSLARNESPGLELLWQRECLRECEVAIVVVVDQMAAWAMLLHALTQLFHGDIFAVYVIAKDVGAVQTVISQVAVGYESTLIRGYETSGRFIVQPIDGFEASDAEAHMLRFMERF